MINIAVRVDVNASIGAGHFMRCLALAVGFKNTLLQAKVEFKITFICADDIPKNYQSILSKHSFSLEEVYRHSNNNNQWLINDAQSVAKAISRFESIQLLIIDHYNIKKCWYVSSISTRVDKTLVIDDLADREHQCDFLLDQTLDAKALRYRGLVPNNCKLLLGKAHMLLRDEFSSLRKKALAKRQSTQTIQNVLISLGGSDTSETNNIVIGAIEALNTSLLTPVNVVLVITSQCSELNYYHSTEQKYPWFSVQQNASNMAELMYQADIAIGASGSSAWERCCLGLPTLAIEFADNQALVLDKLSQRNALINLGKAKELTQETVKNALSTIINKPEQYQNMSENAFECCDGKGVVRTIQKLQLSVVNLRPAVTEDKDLLFDWQSQPSVRKYSRSNHQISYEEHCHWFAQSISNSPTRHLFIVKECWQDGSECSVGMLRLDLQNSQYEISILICPSQQGRGLALKAIESIPSKYKSLPITAAVHPDNIASQILFSKAGFTKVAKDLFILEPLLT
ncbi:UDP-N-acetylglucosamine--N-acetylmuramyl-(pentapeptide) pyrophosphoryl-undecaprenol N-acetylglucosamine transferase [Pseudoalteromonas sp. CIP111854]|uniref:UDP-N-acetylglucosamine--N-acetylmuramyl-(Pentapeptide) pyrophosphoryl-undecaprenol N-acetylglucosamine transferase n=1 Tax=Pseudoalteromonas holothuriae TaxID=2963714 RepID=A0A9W4QWX4_9GAMM|nr:UDP-2,4-diacetamido-2,4,6-trideoxy-beta-L-altropyranose hydrolase [Pseudoalteromonas sp. CIP111854]CAH9056948.1 UDP-N-acetylglucosamine--N-acetylmuramyl-(pentapeptide) pyrophosphoryl-undecaprenol N-acetylglucosamine transferase [Pseudoalteromonas sp. CIP111854]